MSYEKMIQKDVPYAYYNLDSAGASRPPLVWAGEGASLITNETITYSLPVFSNRNQAYAIEVWFRPLDERSISVIGHSEGDGLKWSNKTISYELWIGDKKIILSYYADIIRTFHVVVSYNSASLSLFVNGELKDSYIFDQDEYDYPYFNFTDPSILQTAGNGNPFIIDAVAFYTDININLPKIHYQWAQPATQIISNVAMQSAETFEFQYENIVTIDENVDITVSYVDNVTTTGGFITQVVNEQSQVLAGSWTGYFRIGDIKNNIVSWDADGPVVASYSLDDTNWTELKNGGYIATTSSSQTYFLLKFTFPANQQIKVENISIVKYDNQSVSSHGGSRTVQLTNQPIFKQYFYPTIAFDRGVSGSLAVSGNEAAAAVEFWIKGPSEDSITSLSGTKKINNDKGWYQNDWNHVVVSGNVPNSFTVGNSDSIVSILNIYVNDPSVPFLYNSYFGNNKWFTNDVSLTTISDGFKQYGYNWSIVISG